MTQLMKGYKKYGYINNELIDYYHTVINHLIKKLLLAEVSLERDLWGLFLYKYKNSYHWWILLLNQHKKNNFMITELDS